jgi:hypothetical protein
MARGKTSKQMVAIKNYTSKKEKTAEKDSESKDSVSAEKEQKRPKDEQETLVKPKKVKANAIEDDMGTDDCLPVANF